MDFNSCNLLGRLTKDAEVSVTKNGTSVAKFSIASNGIKDSVNYFDIVLTQNVDKVSQYLKKGRMVIVTCTAKQDRWQDRNTGESKSRIVFYTQAVTFINSGSASRSDNPADEYVTKAAAEAKQQQKPLPTTHFTEEVPFGDEKLPAPENFDDDIPF